MLLLYICRRYASYFSHVAITDYCMLMEADPTSPYCWVDMHDGGWFPTRRRARFGAPMYPLRSRLGDGCWRETFVLSAVLTKMFG